MRDSWLILGVKCPLLRPIKPTLPFWKTSQVIDSHTQPPTLSFPSCRRLRPQKHTFLHMVTQMCLSIGRLEDGTYGPRVDYCNGSPRQNWLLRNYTHLEVAKNLYFSPAEYFI